MTVLVCLSFCWEGLWGGLEAAVLRFSPNSDLRSCSHREKEEREKEGERVPHCPHTPTIIFIVLYNLRITHFTVDKAGFGFFLYCQLFLIEIVVIQHLSKKGTIPLRWYTCHPTNNLCILKTIIHTYILPLSLHWIDFSPGPFLPAH